MPPYINLPSLNNKTKQILKNAVLNYLLPKSNISLMSKSECCRIADADADAVLAMHALNNSVEKNISLKFEEDTLLLILFCVITTP